MLSVVSSLAFSAWLPICFPSCFWWLLSLAFPIRETDRHDQTDSPGGVLTVFLSVLVELFAHGGAPYAAMRAFYYGRESKAGGGLLGGMIASGLVEGFGLISAYVLTFVIMIVCLILITERSLLQQAGSRRRRKKRRYADPNEDREARLARIRADKKRQAAARSGR